MLRTFSAIVGVTSIGVLMAGKEFGLDPLLCAALALVGITACFYMETNRG